MEMMHETAISDFDLLAEFRVRFPDGITIEPGSQIILTIKLNKYNEKQFYGATLREAMDNARRELFAYEGGL